MPFTRKSTKCTAVMLSKPGMGIRTRRVRYDSNEYACCGNRNQRRMVPPALLNTIETLGNLLYVYLMHIAPHPAAPLVGFASATMTWSKTILNVSQVSIRFFPPQNPGFSLFHALQEYYCDGCSIRHNNLIDIVMYWITPNACVKPCPLEITSDMTLISTRIWFLFSSLIIRTLWKDISASLRIADKVSSGKTR
jgi:hypothetical protein